MKNFEKLGLMIVGNFHVSNPDIMVVKDFVLGLRIKSLGKGQNVFFKLGLVKSWDIQFVTITQKDSFVYAVHSQVVALNRSTELVLIM